MENEERVLLETEAQEDIEEIERAIDWIYDVETRMIAQRTLESDEVIKNDLIQFIDGKGFALYVPVPMLKERVGVRTLVDYIKRHSNSIQILNRMEIFVCPHCGNEFPRDRTYHWDGVVGLHEEWGVIGQVIRFIRENGGSKRWTPTIYFIGD